MNQPADNQSIDTDAQPTGTATISAAAFELGGEPVSGLDAMLDEQHPRKRAARDWAAEHLGAAPDSFDRVRWRRAAEAGFLSLTVPQHLGGLGRTLVDAMLSFEGLGAGTSDSGLVFALASHSFAFQQAFVSHGTCQQHDRWLSKLMAGSAIGAFAMSEPDAGSDIATITTTAEPGQDDPPTWHLTGTKSWVTLGPVADVAIVFASTDPSRGRWGITAFVVETDRAGVTIGPAVDRMGLSGAPFGTITFDQVMVTTDDLLGVVGAGGSIFATAVEAERALLYAPQLGATERLLDQAIERSCNHQSAGQPIGNFQAVSHRLADLKVELEASRLLAYKAAVLADLGQPVTLAAAIAKIKTSDMAINGALDAMRVFGAEGYTIGAGIEAELRHALAGLNFAGTSDVQRNVVASLLGVGRLQPT